AVPSRSIPLPSVRPWHGAPIGLAPQPVALVGFDLKGEVELSPYAPRLTALATTRGECLDLLADLIRVMDARMLACRQLAVRDIWQLPDRSEEHTSELQSRENLVCRLLLEKKKLTFKP